MSDTTAAPPLELSGEASKAQEVTAKVVSLLCDHLGCKADELKLTTNLVEEHSADSLDAIEIVMCLEEAFEIDITDEEADTYQTVGDIVDSIIRLTK